MDAPATDRPTGMAVTSDDALNVTGMASDSPPGDASRSEPDADGEHREEQLVPFPDVESNNRLDGRARTLVRDVRDAKTEQTRLRKALGESQ